MISRECFSFDELQTELTTALQNGSDGRDESRWAVMRRYLAAQSGPLACERMVDVLDRIVQHRPPPSKPSIRQRLDGYYRSYKRRLKKRFRGMKSELSHNRSDFLRHRYPAISMDTMRERMRSIQEALGEAQALQMTRVHRKFFRISM